MHQELKLSLETLKKFSDDVPGLGNFANRALVSDYEGFVSILYNDIDLIVSKIEQNPELYKNDSEDRITIDIINQLCAMGYVASHEKKIGGHTDMLVEKPPKTWLWIGEAKIHSSYPYLFKGFRQLTTRYTSGTNDTNQGGMLIYIRQANTQNIMNKWRDYLNKINLRASTPFNLNTSPCNQNPLSFYSIHIHQRSGLPFTTRHIPLVLHFNPEDNS